MVFDVFFISRTLFNYYFVYLWHISSETNRLAGSWRRPSIMLKLKIFNIELQCIAQMVRSPVKTTF